MERQQIRKSQARGMHVARKAAEQSAKYLSLEKSVSMLLALRRIAILVSTDHVVMHLEIRCFEKIERSGMSGSQGVP